MRRVLVACLLVLAIAGLVVSTTGAEVVTHQQTDVLELEPAGEGTYTQIDDDTGEIQIILTEENPNLNAEGVNPNAVTDIGPVFTVENVLEQRSNATVWISHDSDAVEFYVPGEGAVESQADGVFMTPGDSATIAMRVDTRETDEVVLDSIDVMAVLDPAIETEGSGDVTELLSVDDFEDDSDTETPESTETDTETESATEAPETDTPAPNQSQSTPVPTASDDSTPGDGTTETDDPVAEQAGLGSPALLGIALLLGGVVATMLLFRRLTGP
ncbi:DUF1102 domain-containing protein [Natronomonas amylolytica]|uniref:DUF1102 domain-containing protein n=1 Tax=Natronomonas amylolytica TaxID=3108498 RepID=UPI00300BC87B